jgi:ATP-dependent Lon protease
MSTEPSAPNVTHSLPVLPLKNLVLFPRSVMPVIVARQRSAAAIEAALASEDKTVAIFTQRDAEVDEPQPQDLYTVGTKAVIKRMARGPQGIELILQGLDRVELLEMTQAQPFLKALVRTHPLPPENTTETEALHREILQLASRMQDMAQPEAPVDFSKLMAQLGDPAQLAYLLASMLNLDTEKQQQLLEVASRSELLRIMLETLRHELQVLELRMKIASQAQSEMTREQREYQLRQQMRAIQQELGESNPEKAQADEIRKRFEAADLPDNIRKEAERELNRLETLPQAAPDYQVTRAYLELILELPWRRTTPDNLDLIRARQVLDEDHFDLKDVKERIREHLAVLKLNPGAKAPILCFVGPPGVGKTSLGKSIARSLERKFERISLGGMHDEAELRGHRRTYIGAMPGRIIQALRRADVANPVLMLDEVDKLGRDFRGDPAAALLEILDPAQNFDFRDNYLDLPFDLSKVFFIATANTLDTIPQPLLDRMEVLRLAGYSEEEKMEIAKRYLIERQRAEAGLTPDQFQVPDETVAVVISRYTREAGVRQLERALGRLARRIALWVAEGKAAPTRPRPEDLPELLGPERFRHETARQQSAPGVATGLAWTEAGGEVLYIESILLPEGSGLSLTGQLGNVMQESARAAQSYVLAHAQQLGITHINGLVHLHVPAGAIPKDGPSAGVAMTVALASLYSNQPVRSDIAMTGEITLAGLVMPVGGIKEKVLAARRAGIRNVIIPRDNEHDLDEIPENARADIRFVLAETVDDALAAAIPTLACRLTPQPV